MERNDTNELLRECSAGTKMAVNSIDDVVDNVQSPILKKFLEESKKDHNKVEVRTRELLRLNMDEDKEPNIMAKGMSKMKTGVKMGINESDNTIADLMTEGCNMGIKSLSKYLNQYKAASEEAKSIAKELIGLEEKLVTDIRPFL